MWRAAAAGAAARLGRTGRRRQRNAGARRNGGRNQVGIVAQTPPDVPSRNREGGLQVSLRQFPLSPPPVFRATLRYVQDFAPTTAAATFLVSQLIVANDTFAPVAGGGQPLFRDQLFAMYNYVRCLAFTVRVEVIGNSSNPAIVLVGPCVSGTPDTTETTAIERPGTMDCMVSGFTNQKRINYAARVTDYFGSPPIAIWNEAFLQNATGTLPAGQACYIQIITSSQKTAVATATLIRMELLQHVQFEQPTQVAAS